MKTLCTFLLLLLSIISFGISVTTTAGNLSDSLSAYKKDTITELMVYGTIDARDFKTMRDSMPSLYNIDLTNVSILGYNGILGTDNLGATNYLPNEIPSWSFSRTFPYNKIILPQSIISLGEYSFLGLQCYTTISIPEKVKIIKKSAFESSTFSIINLNDGIDSLIERCFSMCYNINTFILPDSLKYIGKEAFADCQNFQNVKFSK